MYSPAMINDKVYKDYRANLIVESNHPCLNQEVANRLEKKDVIDEKSR